MVEKRDILLSYVFERVIFDCVIVNLYQVDVAITQPSNILEDTESRLSSSSEDDDESQRDVTSSTPSDLLHLASSSAGINFDNQQERQHFSSSSIGLNMDQRRGHGQQLH